MLKSIVLPEFPGFYHSLFSSFIDYEIESIGEGEEIETVIDFTGVASKACSLFSKETEVALQFELLQSPREYNFTTDKIFALIHIETVKNMYASTPKDLLNQAVKDRHSSYSGFISFYPNDLSEWPIDLTDWDHNHLSTLLYAYLLYRGISCDTTWEEIAETMASNGNFDEYVTVKGE